MSRSEILQVIKAKVCDIVYEINADSITESSSLKDLGLNSIDRSDVIMDMCDEFDVNISMIEFAGLKNIGEIINVFEKNLR